MNVDNALHYLKDHKLAVIPIDPDKKPYISWTEFQKRLPTEDEVKKWYEKWPDAGVGAVTGKISNLYLVDIDNLNNKELIDEQLSDNCMMPVSTTPRPGSHFHFSGNGKEYASVINQELGIDFKGEGGYTVLPDSFTRGEDKQGNKYEGNHSWLPGFSLDEVDRPPIPDKVVKFISNGHARNVGFKDSDSIASKDSKEKNAYKDPLVFDFDNAIYTSGGASASKPHQDSIKAHHLASNRIITFTKGSRDDDLFHTAICLTRGGMDENNVSKVINILGLNCDPPFPQSEIKNKIKSALERASKKERNLTELVREYVSASNGIFLASNLYKEHHLASSEEKHYVRTILSRMAKGPNAIIKRVGNRDGEYVKINTEVEVIEWRNATQKTLDVKLPLGIHQRTEFYPRWIVTVSGVTGTGKTCFALNTAKLNQDRYPIHYLTNELNGPRFRRAISKFGLPDSAWKFDPIMCYESFEDHVQPDGFNIIDYLEVIDDTFNIGKYIRAIQRKLNKGGALILTQKKLGARQGIGGQFSHHAADLSICLEWETLWIEKNRYREADKTPHLTEVKFTIENGLLKPVGKWYQSNR